MADVKYTDNRGLQMTSIRDYRRTVYLSLITWSQRSKLRMKTVQNPKVMGKRPGGKWRRKKPFPYPVSSYSTCMLSLSHTAASNQHCCIPRRSRVLGPVTLLGWPPQAVTGISRVREISERINAVVIGHSEASSGKDWLSKWIPP